MICRQNTVHPRSCCSMSMCCSARHGSASASWRMPTSPSWWPTPRGSTRSSDAIARANWRCRRRCISWSSCRCRRCTSIGGHDKSRVRREDVPVPAPNLPAPPLAPAATRTEVTSRVTSAGSGAGAAVAAGIGTEPDTESDRAPDPYPAAIHADFIATNYSFSVFNCGTKKKRFFKLF